MFHNRSAAHVRRDRSIRCRHKDTGYRGHCRTANVSDRLRGRREIRLALRAFGECDCYECV